MILIILFGPFVIYAILKFLLGKLEITYGEKTGKILLGLNCVMFLVCVFSEIMASKNMHIAGYRTPAILIAITSFTISCQTLFRKEIKNEINPLIFIFGGFCFTVGSLFTFEISGDYEKQLIYDDKKYRIEQTSRGIGEPRNYKIFIKNGLLDYVHNLNYPCYLNFEKIEIVEKNNTLLNIKIQHNSESELCPNPFEIEIKR